MNTTEPKRAVIQSKTATAMVVRFVTNVPRADSRVVLEFTDPMPAYATAEPIEISQLPSNRSWPEPGDQLHVLIIPPGALSAVSADQWLKPADLPDAPQAISIPIEKGKLSWRSGRAVIEGSLTDQTLSALAQFAFYETQLRKLEEAVKPFEASAINDAARAYRVHGRDRNRFGEVTEALALLRLTFARLEPRLYVPDRSQPITSRQIIARLSRRAAIEDRLEAINHRLEACEDLYEGAIDRLNDHLWYRRGNLLEIAIVVLLMIEVLQLCSDMLLRFVLHVTR